MWVAAASRNGGGDRGWPCTQALSSVPARRGDLKYGLWAPGRLLGGWGGGEPGCPGGPEWGSLGRDEGGDAAGLPWSRTGEQVERLGLGVSFPSKWSTAPPRLEP